MAEQSAYPMQGRLGELRLRVADAERGARFFSALLGAKIASSPDEDCVETVLTDDEGAPPTRLCFATVDPEAALAATRELGGSGAAIDAAEDDQGVPLEFYSPSSVAEREGGKTAAVVGGAIVFVADTAKARAFHRQLFGQEFHRVGSGDFWWASDGQGLGIFPDDHDVTNPQVPRAEKGMEIRTFFSVPDLEDALARIRELGGKTLDRATMGPMHVCDCRDDQGTRFGLLAAVSS